MTANPYSPFPSQSDLSDLDRQRAVYEQVKSNLAHIDGINGARIAKLEQALIRLEQRIDWTTEIAEAINRLATALTAKGDPMAKAAVKKPTPKTTGSVKRHDVKAKSKPTAKKPAAKKRKAA